MKNLAKERAREIAEQNKLMKNFGRLPQGYNKWIERELFYDGSFLAFNNKTRKAYCTLCENEHEIPKKINYKHNSEGTCPVCGNTVTYIRETVAKYEHAVKWALVVQRSGEDILLRYICNMRDYSNGYRTREDSYKEMLRTLCTKDASPDFQYNYVVNGWIPYREEQWSITLRPTIYDLPLEGVTLYNADKLRQTLKGTWAEYSGAEEIINQKHQSKSFLLENYLNLYRRTPAVEKLARVGFTNLIHDTMGRWAYKPIVNPQATDLRSALGLSAYQVKLLLREKNPSAKNLEVLKKYPNISIELWDLIKKYDQSVIKEIMKWEVNKVKALAYMKEQEIRYSDYRDHLEQLTELGINKTAKNLYPENFRAAHARLTGEVIRRREEKKAVEREEINALISIKHKELMQTKPLSLKENGLMVMFPSSYEDLANEGEKLHHCVRTYADKIADGKTMVFFIRRESEPDVPYYTLEWFGGSIIQCRGKFNQPAQGETMKFAEHFSRELSNHFNIHLAA